MEPTASWVENDFESRPVEHLKDIIDNEFECLIDIENDQEHISRSFDHVNLENLAIFMKEERISRISGVNYINGLINEDPLKYDLSKFMNFLKNEFEAIIVRSKTLPQHETQKIQTYVQKEFFLLQTNGNIHKSFVSALNSLNTDHHVQSETNILEHDYSKIDKSTVKKIFPLIAPVIPSISEQNIPIIQFDNLPISDIDCYYLILSVCSYFWNINRWPVSQKIISGDLCNIENLRIQIPINITSQEKLHNLYYFGWVIMATRKEIIRMKEALSLPKHAQSIEVCAVNKDNVLHLINILGEDKAKGKLKSGAPYFEYEVKEDVLPFFNYLAACCVKLLDKNVMAIYKNNTLKNALEKLSSCETLRKKFIDMLEKCGPVKPEITLADNFF